MLKVVKSYATEKQEQYSKQRDCAYLSSVYVGRYQANGIGERINSMTDGEMLKIIDDNHNVVLVDASGPYGRFWSLEKVDLFREMAEVAPNAKFVGGMGGFDVGGDSAAAFELKGGLLHCKYAFPEEDECWYEGDDDENWDDNWEDDEWYEEEPNWTVEKVYDPIAKKIIKSN